MPVPNDSALAERLGLNVPYEWWPASPLLKEIEASGFGWVQIPSPPGGVLADPRSCIRHASGVGRSIATTGLRSVLHAPTGLLAGGRESNRVLEGAISYAAECGAEQIVYHARAVVEGPGIGQTLAAETRALADLAPIAERLGITIAIENLAPVYPGPETLSAVPAVLRALAQRLGSEAIRLCLDVGHANLTAALRRTALEALVDPVLDSVSLFHLHDNLGARRQPDDRRPGLDPLRLDLHLAPGRGTLPWGAIAHALRQHSAPLLLEVHPPHRPPTGELAALTLAALRPNATSLTPT